MKTLLPTYSRIIGTQPLTLTSILIHSESVHGFLACRTMAKCCCSQPTA